MDGYAAHSRIPTLKIAKVKYARDPKGGPCGGSRVKYAIAAAGPNKDSVYDRVEEIEEFIFGARILDIDYYIQVRLFIKKNVLFFEKYFVFYLKRIEN